VKTKPINKTPVSQSISCYAFSFILLKYYFNEFSLKVIIKFENHPHGS